MDKKTGAHKPTQESLRNVSHIMPMPNNVSVMERRVKGRTKVALKEGDKVGAYKIIDVIESDRGVNEIFVVQNDETQDVHCLKVEARDQDEKYAILKMELFILLEIRKKADARLFCKIYDRGQEKQFNWLVMTLTGPSLKNLRHDLPGKKLTLGCGLSVGKACLQALEQLHRIGYIHRDVSPSNFACGRREFEEERKIYALDFGYCHQYRDSSGALKRPRPKPTPYTGGLRFYMFVELLKGGLPWMNLKDPGEVYRYQRKCRTGLEKEEMLGGLPAEFEEIMYVIDRISYHDDPDYGTIYNHIDRIMTRSKVEEFPYDWEEKANGNAADAGTPAAAAVGTPAAAAVGTPAAAAIGTPAVAAATAPAAAAPAADAKKGKK